MEPEWSEKLKAVMNTPRYLSIHSQVLALYESHTIFPDKENIFRAFWLTSFSSVRVVILGQDPYHDDGQAQGLAFSVPKDMKLPPSLVNIYRELESDIGVRHSQGDLSGWAKQGVFLLNSILTVEAHAPASHRDIGWEWFTDEVIQILSNEKENLVFILWGKHAQTKKRLIDASKHLVIESAHPSPLSVYRGFFGSKPFSKTNAYLRLNRLGEIEW